MKKSSGLSTTLVITAYHKDSEMVELTKKCINSLKNGRPDNVIVVDDHSPIEIKFDGVENYRRLGNGGFPECANTGFRLAANKNTDVIILSNNDLEYCPGWLEAILEPLRQGFDISSVNMSDSDGLKTENSITEDDYFGSLWAMKREVYKTIGGFDTRFKNGTFEDKDFYVRAKDAGFRIGKNHAVVVNHKGRATMDKLYPKQEDFHTNAQRFKDKYGYII